MEILKMHRFKHLAITILLIFVNSSLSMAATYYADAVNGNDTAAGSSSAPWRTLSKCLSIVNDGDIIKMRTGNYGDFQTSATKSRTNWVTFQADTGHKPVFTRVIITGNNYNVYLRFDGITIQHPTPSPMPPNDGYRHTNVLGEIFYTSAAHYIDILNCTVRGYNKYLSLSPYFVNSNYITLQHCEITNLRRGPMVIDCSHYKCINNHIYHMSEGSGVRVQGNVTDILIERNHVHDHHASPTDPYYPKNDPDAYHGGSAISIRSSNVTIRSNIIHDYDGQGIKFYINEAGLTPYKNMLVENNLIYDTSNYTAFDNIGGPVIIRNNTIVGSVRYPDPMNMYNVLDRYTGVTIMTSLTSGFDGTGVQIYNNVFVGRWQLPPVTQKYLEDYNIWWSRYDATQTPRYMATSKGTHSLICVRQDSSSALRGYPEYFENLPEPHVWTADYPSTSTYKAFFVKPGFFTTNQSGPGKDNGLTFDYHLAAGSPGINFGSASYQPSDSLGTIGADGFILNNGPARDSTHHSAGCYEAGGATQPPPTNNPPVADAGSDQTLTDLDGSGSQQVTLDGSGSSDAGGSIVNYIWTENGSQIATGVNAVKSFSIGHHTITLQVIDNGGLTDTDTVVITVEAPISDTTPPSITSVTASAHSVDIQFNEPLDSVSAANAQNYSISAGLTIDSVLADNELNRVTLYTSMHLEGGSYTLNVINVKDSSGNAMPLAQIEYTYNAGLIGYYAYDYTDMNIIIDHSGYDNTGTYLNGAAATVQGELLSSGGDDAAQISTNSWNSGQGTITAWIKQKNTPGMQYIFGHAVGNWTNKIQLYLNNGDLCLGLGDSHQLKTNIALMAAQTWYNLALTWDGTNYKIYIDGIEKASGVYSGLTQINATADIGNNGNPSDRSEGFDGLIDEVHTYNKVLTQTEISDMGLAFLPIGDQTVVEGNQLSFTIRTKPGTTVSISDHNLPSAPLLVSNVFTWTPNAYAAGNYEVEFTAQNGSSISFEKIKISVINVQQIKAVGFWKFDETSGDIAYDSSPTGNNGYLKNGLTWDTGIHNGAIDFSVPNDAVEIKTTNFDPRQGTIAMWVYVDNLTMSMHYLFGHANSSLTDRIQIYLKYGKLCIGLGNSHETTKNIQRLQLKKWYHIALNWNNGDYKFYIDGVLKASGTYSGLNGLADYADIGNNGMTRDKAFNGKIDDLQIYDRALNPNEIGSLAVGKYLY